MRRRCSPIRFFHRSSPPPPFSLSFVEVVAMDKSRGSSNEVVSGSKRCRDEPSADGADLEYEASLRSKLEAEHTVREQVARDREAWAAGPEWLQRDERARSLGSSSSLATGSGSSAPPVADPWEVAAAGVWLVLLPLSLALRLLHEVRLCPLAFLLVVLDLGPVLILLLATTTLALLPSSSRSVGSLLPLLIPPPPVGALVSSPYHPSSISFHEPFAQPLVLPDVLCLSSVGALPI
ncbi:hypothetical protein D1007_35269 [Hordeum vulgare]|nr:hypothetical protein D1007_35269 [Hordeum vulgare]